MTDIMADTPFSVTWENDLSRNFGDGSQFAHIGPRSLAAQDVLPINVHDPVMAGLFAEIARLRSEVAVLSRRMSSPVPVQESRIRALDEVAARKEVKGYFESHHGKIIYPDEIAEALNLDVIQVIRICENLDQEGEIGKTISSGNAA